MDGAGKSLNLETAHRAAIDNFVPRSVQIVAGQGAVALCGLAGSLLNRTRKNLTMNSDSRLGGVTIIPVSFADCMEIAFTTLTISRMIPSQKIVQRFVNHVTQLPMEAGFIGKVN